MRTKEVVHVEDLLEDADGPNNPAAKYGNARTYLGVPMRKDDELIGAIVIYRTEVRPFTDKQIELVRNFAAQAVIAIENTRLLKELRQRTDDLSESLEQQTATSEVLSVISSSPGELEPVFHAMLANATRICEAKFGIMCASRGRQVPLRRSCTTTSPEFTELRRRNPVISAEPDSPWAVSLVPGRWSTSPICGRAELTPTANPPLVELVESAALAPFSSCRCSRTMS